MYVSKDELENWLQVCADVAKVTINQKMKEFYWRNLHRVDNDKVRDAINLFGIRGHFPTVQELLVECGYFAPRSQAEREEQERRQEAMKKSDEITDDPEKTPAKISGNWTWYADKITHSRQEAEAFFQEVQRDHLEPHGWTVHERTINDFWKEITEGKRSYRAQGFRCFFHSTKPEAGARDAKTV